MQNNTEKDTLIILPSAMQESLTDEVADVLCNITEIGLDTVMNEGLLREIPFLSTAVSMFNIGNSIKERHYLIKLTSFISCLNIGIVDENRREYYKRKVTDDMKKRNRELEYIMVLIDRYIHINKPAILAKLYLAYLDERITWDDFTKYAEVVDRFLPGDCDTLLSAATFKTERDINTDSIQRLIALGLVIEGCKRSSKIHIFSPQSAHFYGSALASN